MSESGKFVLRIPPELHAKLKEGARRQGISLNDQCNRLLSGATSGRGAEDLLQTAISHEYGADLEGVVLFGSAARGELGDGSDIDLLLVTRGPVERELYRRWDESAQLAEAARSFSHPVNPQFARLPSAPDKVGGLWLEIAIDGRLLWDRDLRIHRLLADLRRRIMAGRFQRLTSHGHPYWVHEKEPT